MPSARKRSATRRQKGGSCMPQDIGRIERVPLREIWPREDLDFTSWLQQNLDVLDQVVNLGIAEAKREQSAGDFAVDLVAQDRNGETVVIENQLERSDHDHLGKLVTYLAALGAKTAVWLVATPRPEHVAAVSWLNQSPDASFYMLKVEAIRIAGSLPAPLLTLIVGPSQESRAAGETKRELSESQRTYQRFWESLLKRAATQINLHSATSPALGPFLRANAGKPGLNLYYVIRKRDASVRLQMDTFDEGKNRAVFENLFVAREQIARDFGGQLEWAREDGKALWWVDYRLTGGGIDDPDKWPEVQQAMIDAMGRFEKALRPHIDALPNPGPAALGTATDETGGTGEYGVAN